MMPAKGHSRLVELCPGLMASGTVYGEAKSEPRLSPEQRKVRQHYLWWWDAMLKANAVKYPDTPERAAKHSRRYVLPPRENVWPVTDDQELGTC
jgi:hypothetical protein